MVALQPFSYVIYTKGAENVTQKNDDDNDGNNPIRNNAIVSNAAIPAATEVPGPLDNNPLGIRGDSRHIHISDGLYDLTSSLFQYFNLRSLILDPQKPFIGFQTAIEMKYSGYNLVG